MGLTQTFSLIQGPPGTGKTEMIASIVAQWHQAMVAGKVSKILVCAPSNYAADLLAERLVKIPSLFDQVVRIKSSRKEDLFTMDPNTLPQYSLPYKILFMDPDKRQMVANLV
mmetsp:Transcript_22880/g.22150  ORF Transcript_22880/g.22150 Transcript_22880/m.22150 type:complete len:112 (-) Transcript_22880:1334-1669(-)